jgi:hypothetical protein
VRTPEQTPELLPCPFCGGEASSAGSVKYDDKHEAWFADGTRITEAFFCNCMVCGATNRGLCGFQTREEAIAAWNRRSARSAEPVKPPAEPTDEQVDALLDEWGEAAGLLPGFVSDLRSELRQLVRAAPEWKANRVDAARAALNAAHVLASPEAEPWWKDPRNHELASAGGEPVGQTQEKA